jgi:hypothetical protein
MALRPWATCCSPGEQAELDSLLQEFLMQAFSENAPGLKVGDYVFHPPVKAFVRK